MVFRNFLGNNFFSGRTPRWSLRVIYSVVGPFWAAGNSGPGSKTEKRDFPDLGALLGGKSDRPKIFSQKWRNFFTFCVLGREIAKY